MTNTTTAYTNIADYRDALWIALRQAHQDADRANSPGENHGYISYSNGYRNGLVTAYAILIDETERDVLTALENGRVA